METSCLFDNAVSDKNVQIMKIALPYIPPQKQKFISLFIIMQEMKNTFSFFQSGGKNAPEIGICSVDSENCTVQNMINDIKKILSEKEREKVDSVLNIFNMLKTVGMYRSMASAYSGAFNGDSFQAMKSMLSPEQQEMFDLYSNMFASGQATE